MRRYFVFFALISFACPVSAQWTLDTQSDPESLGPQIDYIKKTIRKRSADSDAKATLHLIFVRGNGLTLKVVDQGAKPGTYPDFVDAMQANFCLAGCNGGFFHPDFRPAGLVIADGRRINKFENAKLLSGVLAVDGSGPRLLRKAEFVDRPEITQLLQSGPFLVDRGRTVAGLSNSPARTRTFVLTGGKDQWAIGICTGISLADLGEVLADGEIISEIEVARGLNLDGGSSSCLYFNRGAGIRPFHHRSFKKPRNFLGIAPR